MGATPFARAGRIWITDAYRENEYGEFLDFFPRRDGAPTELRITVAGDYSVWVNGTWTASSQYGDYPHYKVYDTVALDRFLRPGKNTLAILVWYVGTSGMRVCCDAPGLMYEVTSGEETLCASGEGTLARFSRAYRSHDSKKITNQLGYSFTYDANAEDGWRNGDREGFGEPILLSRWEDLFPRPIGKHTVRDLRAGKIVWQDGHYLVDLGEETVGFLSLALTAERSGTVTVSYGELLENGRVKRFIGNRDFSVIYVAKAGENAYFNPMLRLGCRYLEVETEMPVDGLTVGVLPQTFPTDDLPFPALEDPLDREIYRICLNTLKLCMMEHYVDCPWREQCFYGFDSRNQMIAGYSAFADGNLTYVGANLRLMAQDRRADGLFAICSPCGDDFTIPSFGLYYIVSVREYLAHGGDRELVRELIPVIRRLLGVYLSARDADGLCCRFSGKQYWHFYDWSSYADGRPDNSGPGPDLLLNAILLLALEAYGAICDTLGLEHPETDACASIRSAARRTFRNSGSGLYFVRDSGEEPTELANSLAILSGIAAGEEAGQICAALDAGTLIPCSLSMKTFTYEALLRIGGDRYRERILREIREDYGKMVQAGSDTVWETVEGAVAFRNAGSLCHGWSAMPIRYYRMFFGQPTAD